MKIILVNFFIVLGLSYASANTTLEELDHFVEECGGPLDVLNSLPGKDEYFLKLNGYFDSKISRDSFDAITRDVANFLKQFPEFRHFLWRDNLETQVIEFQGLHANEEYDINVDKWISIVEEYVLSIKKKSQFTKSHEVYSLIEKYESILKKQEQDLNPVGYRQRKILFYNSLRLNKEFSGLIAFLAQTVFSNPSVQSSLRTANFEIVSEQLLKLSNKNFIRSTLDEYKIDKLLSFIIKELPQFNTLKEDVNLFPRITREGRYSNYVIGRTKSYQNYRSVRVQPFHALFTGAVHNECCGGSARSDYNNLLPSRWALSILPSTITEFVEVNGQYNGVIRFLPFERRNLKVMSVDMMVLDFGRRFKEVLPDGYVKWTSVFDLWLKHQWGVFDMPLVLSESLEGRNVGNPTVKLDSISFKHGYRFGPALSFSPMDSEWVFKLLEYKKPFNTLNIERYLRSDFTNLDSGEAVVLREPMEVKFNPGHVSRLAQNGNFIGLKFYLKDNLFPQSLIIHIYNKFLEEIDSNIILTVDNLLEFETFFSEFNSIEKQNRLKDHLKAEIYEKTALIGIKNSFERLEDIPLAYQEKFISNTKKILASLDPDLALKIVERELAKVTLTANFDDPLIKDFYSLLTDFVSSKMQEMPTSVKRALEPVSEGLVGYDLATSQGAPSCDVFFTGKRKDR